MFHLVCGHCSVESLRGLSKTMVFSGKNTKKTNGLWNRDHIVRLGSQTPEDVDILPFGMIFLFIFFCIFSDGLLRELEKNGAKIFSYLL